MRLRRAVLQNPAKCFVPLELPFHNSNPILTHSESTLLQLLIPLHFNSRRINIYKKSGRGSLPFSPKVSQLVTTHTSPYRSLSTVSPLLVTPFPATLTSYLQLAENKTTLNPVVATLTDRVKHKSFACHSYKKHPGVGYLPAPALFRFIRPTLVNSFRIRTCGKTRGEWSAPAPGGTDFQSVLFPPNTPLGISKEGISGNGE